VTFAVAPAAVICNTSLPSVVKSKFAENDIVLDPFWITKLPDKLLLAESKIVMFAPLAMYGIIVPLGTPVVVIVKLTDAPSFTLAAPADMENVGGNCHVPFFCKVYASFPVHMPDALVLDAVT
jgi:hypothetical protein